MSVSFGSKLRIQRENLGLTQEELAKAVGISSEFVSLLELGKRQPSLETLRAIFVFFNKDPSYFLEERETAFEKLTGRKALTPKAEKELKKFAKYCGDYLEMEETLGRRLELAPAYSHTQPERLALEERQRLGLGDAPIRNIFSLVECNGLRVFRQVLDPQTKIAGIFLFLRIKEAAFSVINSSLPLGDQILTAAHQYYHFLCDRGTDPIIDNTDVLVDEYVSLYHPREKFAHQFAKRLLMPPTKIRSIIEKDLRTIRIRYEDVIYLGRYFGTGTVAMLQALRDLDCLSYSQVEEFENREHEAYEKTLYGKPDGINRISKAKTIPSDRFKNLAVLVSRTEKK